MSEEVNNDNEVKVTGNNAWKLISKVENGSDHRSTFAMEVEMGVLVLVNTKQGESINETVTYVPEVNIYGDTNGRYISKRERSKKGGARNIGANQTVTMDSEM
jgi:hypothetical protein